MLDLDALGLTAREMLHEHARELIAQTCAWSVGLSDQPHYAFKDGRLAPTGTTLGIRAESGLPLATEGGGRLDLADAQPGTFRDALNAPGRDGRLLAERLDDEVLRSFAVLTGVRTLEQLGQTSPQDLSELLDEVGLDGGDLPGVVHALEWDELLRTDAEDLVVAALGDVALLDVEREGVPLSVVQAAERLTAEAAPTAEVTDVAEPDEGVMFLSEAAIEAARLPRPVPPTAAHALLEALLDEGLEPEEIKDALPHLPVLADTAERVVDLLDAGG